MAATLLSCRRTDVVRLRRQIVQLGRVRWAWQAPSCDCYALLGVPSTASSSTIKAAYLQKAKSVHPDRNSSESSQMVQLNLCYEALTKRRTEYDVAKGTGIASRKRAAAYATGGEAWWKDQSREAPDPFHDFTNEWEEAFTRQWYSTKHREHSKAKSSNSWQQWAEAWRFEMDEEEDESVFSRRRKKKGGKQRRHAERYENDDEYGHGRYARRGRHAKAHRHQDMDSTDSDDDDEEFSEPRRNRGQKKSNKKNSQNNHDARDAQADGTSSESSEQSKRRGATRKEPPAVLFLKGLGRGRVAAIWDLAVGKYDKLDENFNKRPAYAQRIQGEGQIHYLLWSQFGDWKLTDGLKDDGTCIAFADDPKGRNPPWISGSPWWRIFDPASRRFVFRRLAVTAWDEGHAERKNEDGGDDQVDDEVPWSRGPWSSWSTPDLLRWCAKQGIDLHGCFDREAVLERVVSAAGNSTANSSNTGRQSGARYHSYAEGDESSSDSDSDGFTARPHARKDKRQRRSDDPDVDLDADVQIASRVKTDGSYTRRPSLDSRVSLYGNRIEPFYGDETAVMPWLYRFGDKSRLYGVFRDGDFGYSLVWKKQKYWGRAGYKHRRESWE